MWRRAPALALLCAAFLALAPAAGLADEVAFAGGTVPLSADAKGTALGTVTPGTPLSVVTQANDLSEVRVDGWSMVGAAQIVFAAKGRRIVLARLTATGPGNRKVLEHSKDAYGIDWEHVVVSGWVPSKDLVSDVSAVWSKADALFKKRCTACHALHQPTEYTANQWPHILRVMTKRAGLSKSETELVTKYLQAHARPQGGPGGAPGGGVGTDRRGSGR